MEKLKERIRELTEQEKKLKAELLECREQLTAMQLQPFHAGDDVICTLPNNKSLKGTFKGKIEIIADTVYIAPYKKDGTLSGRHYMVIPEEGKNYSDYFQKTA